ncbi:glutathione S-transferase [Shewanella sp. GXUN23E]|uniref:glutathione S-transferase n=1 Tax=Shewanella sp. GXUN23E TaxID=3422498 RepID=UPI003D7D1A90
MKTGAGVYRPRSITLHQTIDLLLQDFHNPPTHKLLPRTMSLSLPLLYSFRRCPYAIRARLALRVCNMPVRLREVVLSNKPEELWALSPKGTVPVMQLSDGTVLTESMDIALHALERMAESPTKDALQAGRHQAIEMMTQCDQRFKPWLDKYKYADRFPEQAATEYRRQAVIILSQWDRQLARSPFLSGNNPGLADWGVLPFVRQFAAVEPDWWRTQPLPQLASWLSLLLGTDTFTQSMLRYPEYRQTRQEYCFPADAQGRAHKVKRRLLRRV